MQEERREESQGKIEEESNINLKEIKEEEPTIDDIKYENTLQKVEEETENGTYLTL